MLVRICFVFVEMICVLLHDKTCDNLSDTSCNMQVPWKQVSHLGL